MTEHLGAYIKQYPLRHHGKRHIATVTYSVVEQVDDNHQAYPVSELELESRDFGYIALLQGDKPIRQDAANKLSANPGQSNAYGQANQHQHDGLRHLEPVWLYELHQSAEIALHIYSVRTSFLPSRRQHVVIIP
jgi:hypothetical protein